MSKINLKIQSVGVLVTSPVGAGEDLMSKDHGSRDIPITKNLRIRTSEPSLDREAKLHLRMSEPYGGHGEADHLSREDAKVLRAHLDRFIDDGRFSLALVLEDVAAECRRQDVLKAQGRFKYHCGDSEMTDGERILVLGEEFGEACRAALENAALANDKHRLVLRAELVQIAAVATKWIEGIDARHGTGRSVK